MEGRTQTEDRGLTDTPAAEMMTRVATNPIGPWSSANHGAATGAGEAGRCRDFCLREQLLHGR